MPVCKKLSCHLSWAIQPQAPNSSQNYGSWSGTTSTAGEFAWQECRSCQALGHPGPQVAPGMEGSSWMKMTPQRIPMDPPHILTHIPDHSAICRPVWAQEQKYTQTCNMEKTPWDGSQWIPTTRVSGACRGGSRSLQALPVLGTEVWPWVQISAPDFPSSQLSQNL